ncbi:MAG: acyl carrier protein [Clostridia bacterium]|nr:acyl carrier protein [Clostridia bacterium]
MTENKIIELVAEQFAVDADSLSRDTAFIDTLGADSLDIVELTMSVEEEFSLPEVAEEDLQKILTIGDLVDYVESVIG